MLLEESQTLLSKNNKKYIDEIGEIEKDIDPSKIDREIKDMLCKIKKGVYC
jgi:hypothetical protein